MNTVFSRLLHELEGRRSTVLVTLIGEQGSVPRGSGSMMLVGPGGRIAGTIGGGAIERTAEREAQKGFAEQSFWTRDYDLSQRTGSRLDMACGGGVRVLFQLVPAADAGWTLALKAALQQMQRNQPGWLIFRKDKPPVLSSSTEFPETTGFLIPLPVLSRAVIFGGGHIALELAPILDRLNFRVVLFDDRAEYSNPQRFPMAEETLCGDYTFIDNHLTFQENDYIIVITEGHRYDFDVERQILQHKLAYIGVIGSKTKTAMAHQRLLACGFTETDIQRIHAPIGLNIKAVTPAEIAVSIAAEMILVRREYTSSGEQCCPMH